jgi:hypothetical protein
VKQPFWVDTSSLVEAHRRLYPLELYGEFWGFLAGKISDGSILAPKKVFEEICAGDDDHLKRFVQSREKELRVFPVAKVQDGFRIIADYVKATYPLRRWAEFLSGGDAWVIAYAMKIGGTVVTEESDSRKKKIRIPTVCRKFDVKFTDINGMLKHFGAAFARRQGAR